MPDQPLIVVALGGNGISTPDEEGNVGQQFAHSANTARQLADLVEAGPQLVVTHGNGPQIGNFMLRNEVAARAIYPLPMEEGQFPAGSMGPKVQGAINFLDASPKPHARAIIGHLAYASDVLAGKTGTVIVKA